jgi:predicted nucleic acid-binding Zn ribbon protein
VPAAVRDGSPRKPQAIGEVLKDLVRSSRFPRRSQSGALAQAWQGAVGTEGKALTRVTDFRNGVLEVTVSSAALYQELATFRKPALLAELARRAQGVTVRDIRFRQG